MDLGLLFWSCLPLLRLFLFTSSPSWSWVFVVHAAGGSLLFSCRELSGYLYAVFRVEALRSSMPWSVHEAFRWRLDKFLCTAVHGALDKPQAVLVENHPSLFLLHFVFSKWVCLLCTNSSSPLGPPSVCDPFICFCVSFSLLLFGA